MSDSAPGQQDRQPVVEADQRAAAALAAQVSTLVGEDAVIRGGELPLWGRMAPPAPRGRCRSGIAWCVALMLLVVAVLRIGVHDAAWPLVLLNAFTLYLYLPAYGVLAYAALTRRWVLAGVSAAIVGCHLVWIGPDLQPATPYVPATADPSRQSDRIRIYYVNVHARNKNLEGILAEARSYDPDVIVLAEMQRWWWMEMIARNPLPDYPYGTNLERRNAGDVGVFSRLPVQRMQQIGVEERFALGLDVAVGDQTLRVFALHSPRPTPNSRNSYFQFWNAIASAVTAKQGPVLVIGDFNATQYSRVYRQLQEGGLRSAHEDRGRGWATTWPSGDFRMPLIRIDHAFLSPEVECVAVEEGEAPGSDHKSLVVDLIVHPATPSRFGR